MVVEFQSGLPEPSEGDADTPVHASGLSTTSRFYVAADGENLRCDRLDQSDIRFVRANDAQDARNGDRLLRVIAAGATATPAFSYTCGTSLDCAAVLTSLKLSDFSAIEDCTRDEDREALKSCTKFWSDDLLVTVTHRDQVAAPQVLSVSVSLMVTVADYRAD